jgi:hypothetical protein
MTHKKKLIEVALPLDDMLAAHERHGPARPSLI